MASQIAFVDALRQRNQGYVAGYYGQAYDVRRLDQNTSGSILQNAPVLTALRARIERTSSKEVIEGAIFDLVVFAAEVDRTNLLLGDVLTDEASPESFTFVQGRPMRPTLWVRTDLACSITRPYPESGAADEMPAAGALTAYDPKYGGESLASEMVLTLAGGIYSFVHAGPNAQLASVQCGVQSTSRTTSDTGNTLGTPTDEPKNRFVAYVPALPGVELERQDHIKYGDVDLMIMQIQTSIVGFTGTVCIVEQQGT